MTTKYTMKLEVRFFTHYKSVKPFHLKDRELFAHCTGCYQCSLETLKNKYQRVFDLHNIEIEIVEGGTG